MATWWRSSVEAPPAGPAAAGGRGAAPDPRPAAGRPPRVPAWRVLAFALLVPLLLRVKLPRLGRWLEPPPPLPPPPDPHEIAALVARIDRLLAAGRPLVRRGCLTRGLTLYRFLRRAGADVALCFGVGKADGDLTGHCWIEHDGAPLAERRDPRDLYVETYRIAAGPASESATGPVDGASGPPAGGDGASPQVSASLFRRDPPDPPRHRAARSRLP
jgi:hypothetical protein